MKPCYFEKDFQSFILDEYQFGTTSLKLKLELNLRDMTQNVMDICMSRVYNVIDNIFSDGILCVEGNESSEMIAASVSNFCIQIPNSLNFEILSELVFHKIHAVAEGLVEVLSVTIIPAQHNFGIGFTPNSPQKYVDGYSSRWWFNQNLKFSDYDDEDLNAETKWEEADLGWPDSKDPETTTPVTPKNKLDSVIIEFPPIK